MMNSLIPVCAWCKMIRTSVGWMAEGHALMILGHSSSEDIRNDLTHGICEPCAKKLREAA